MFTESLKIYLCIALFISVSSASMLSPHETHIARDEFYSRRYGRYQSCQEMCAYNDIHQIFMDQETRPCVWSKYCSVKYKIAFSGCKEGTLYDTLLNGCAPCDFCSKVYKDTDTPVYSEYMCDFYCKTNKLGELQGDVQHVQDALETTLKAQAIALKWGRMFVHANEKMMFWSNVVFGSSVTTILLCVFAMMMMKYNRKGTVRFICWTRTLVVKIFGEPENPLFIYYPYENYDQHRSNMTADNSQGPGPVNYDNVRETVTTNQSTVMQLINESNNTTEVDNPIIINGLDQTTGNSTQRFNTMIDTDSLCRSLSASSNNLASNILDPTQLNDSEDDIDSTCSTDSLTRSTANLTCSMDSFTSSTDSFTSSTDSFSGISLHEDDEDHIQHILSTENTNENSFVNEPFLDQSCSGVRYRGCDRDRLCPK